MYVSSSLTVEDLITKYVMHFVLLPSLPGVLVCELLLGLRVSLTRIQAFGYWTSAGLRGFCFVGDGAVTASVHPSVLQLCGALYSAVCGSEHDVP